MQKHFPSTEQESWHFTSLRDCVEYVDMDGYEITSMLNSQKLALFNFNDYHVQCMWAILRKILQNCHLAVIG